MAAMSAGMSSSDSTLPSLLLKLLCKVSINVNSNPTSASNTVLQVSLPPTYVIARSSVDVVGAFTLSSSSDEIKYSAIA